MSYKHYLAAIAPLLLSIPLMLPGCAGSAGRRGQAGPCALLPDAFRPGGELRLALRDDVDAASLPFARNDSEALLFAQLYETLVVLDCQGRPRPALAESWRSSEGGRVWEFTLRRRARFWDGNPVEAADVIASWLWSEWRASAEGRLLPCPELQPFGERVRIIDERRIALRLATPIEDLPARLAWPAYAVSAGRRLLHWRLGTGSLRPASLRREPAESLLCLPNELHPRPAACERLVCRRFPGTGPYLRPAEDGDAFLLRDRDRLPYYRRLAGVKVLPLPPDRLYALVASSAGEAALISFNSGKTAFDSSSAGKAAPSAAVWLPELHADLRQGDLFHSDAMPASPETLLEFLPALRPRADGADEAPAPGAGPGLLGPGAKAPRILHYRENDPAARELAQRISVLASPPHSDREGRDGQPSAYLRTAGLAARDFDLMLRETLSGLCEGAFIVSFRRGEAPPEFLTEAAVLPLILTRAHLVVRDGLAGLPLAGDGLPRLAAAGWRKGERP